MCFAILRVSYKNDKGATTSECDSPAAMKIKIAELQAKPEVSKVGVFVCQQHIERVENWVATPYTAPASEGQP